MDLLTLILTVCLLGLVYYNYFYKPKKNIFDDLGIPYVKPLPFFGNVIPCLLRKSNYIEVVEKLYNTFPNVKYFGMFDFQTPVIVIRDRSFIESISIPKAQVEITSALILVKISLRLTMFLESLVDISIRAWVNFSAQFLIKLNIIFILLDVNEGLSIVLISFH